MKILKRILILLLVLALLCGAGLAGVFALKKARGMYQQIIKDIDSVHRRVLNSQIYTEQKLKEVNASIWLSERDYDFSYDWIAQHGPLIAHAGGGIDGHNYTNSLDAFLYNYEQGYRVFEFDFDLAEDGLQFASHDENRWRQYANADEDAEYSHENVSCSLLLEQYEALGFRDVLDLMAQHPDVYVITDTKYTDEATFKYQLSQLVWYAQKTDPSVLDRLIVQIYHEEMLNWAMDVYPFRSVLLTLYKHPRTPEEVYEFCRRSGVRCITVPQGNFIPEMPALWDELGVNIAVHTVNDADAAQQFIHSGVDMIYTDFLSPADFT